MASNCFHFPGTIQQFWEALHDCGDSAQTLKFQQRLEKKLKLFNPMPCTDGLAVVIYADDYYNFSVKNATYCPYCGFRLDGTIEIDYDEQYYQ